VCTTFDWPEIPELYVTQTPVFNAGAFGVDHPFIVLHSAALELLDDDETRVLLGHELGHVMSGHAFYRTIAAILLLVGAKLLPGLGSIVILPIELAFLEWSRKAELSSDRAGLLSSQDPAVAQSLYMKMAGGVRPPYMQGQLDLDTFMAQASEYANSNEGLDLLYKLLSTLLLTHPMHTVRAAELQRWIAGGDYDRILRGEYSRRGPGTTDRPLRPDINAAGEYYANEARETFGQVVDAAKKAAGRVGDAFKKAKQS
jgi:Zn-dependent protease with chaperone function